jgi:nucleoside-diphosphate-sugar epimerase
MTVPHGSSLSGRVVLVTGASGFIGATLARRLSDLGAIVHGVSRRPPGEPGGVRWWESDLSDPGGVRRLLDAVAPDVIFHLAGLVTGARDVAAVLPVLHANLVATVNLLVAATERRGARIVLAGSMEEPSQEGTLPVPSSPYAASKLAAASYARMFHALYGTPAVWLRLFMVYGPAQPDTRKLVPYVTLSLLRGEAPMLSSGRRGIDWIYVHDVVDALLAAAAAQGIEGRTLDVGSGSIVTIRSMVERLVQMIDPAVVPQFGALPDRPLEHDPVADVNSTASCLGWRPRTPLEEGLHKTVDWYRQHSTRRDPAPEKGGLR